MSRFGKFEETLLKPMLIHEYEARKEEIQELKYKERSQTIMEALGEMKQAEEKTSLLSEGELEEKMN